MVDAIIAAFYNDVVVIRQNPNGFFQTIQNDSEMEDAFKIPQIAARTGHAVHIIRANFLHLLGNAVRLGNQGGFGIPYQIGNYYMKEVGRRPARDDRTYAVIYTPTNKTLLRVSSYCIEYIIGTVLSAYLPDTITPSFMNTYFCICAPDLADFQPRTYTFYEILIAHDERFGHQRIRVLPDQAPVNLPYSITNVHYAIFQTLFAIHNAQSALHFVHNDLHIGNIMYRPYGDAPYINSHTYATRLKKYQLLGNLYVYTKMNFDTVIIDYGVSRLETERYIVTNVLDRLIGQDESTEKFQFNPYIDVATFLLSLSQDSNNVTQQLAELLLTQFLRLHNVMALHQFHAANRIPGNWRLRARCFKETAQLPLTALELIELLPIHEINDQVQLMNQLTLDNVIVKSTINLPDDMFHNVYTNVNIQFPNHHLEEGNKTNRIHDIPDPTPLSTIIQPVNYFDFPVIQGHVIYRISNYYSENALPNTHQVLPQPIYGHKKMYHAMMNQGDHVYQFKLDCCHIDSISYLEDERIMSGVAINAAFFQINTDFQNIGNTQINPPPVLTTIPIPQHYQDVYHQILITNQNTIHINPQPYSAGALHQFAFGNHVAEFYSGPLLVSGGAIVFTAERYDTVVNGVHIFQCDPSPLDVPFLDRNGINVKNCNPPSLPGELFHAANMNPRSALVTTTENLVHFISVPGRMPGVSEGMTLDEFAYYLHATIPHIDMAINLDGGGSSRICIKEPGGAIGTFHSSINHIPYPVGSILSFVQMQPAIGNPFVAQPSNMIHFHGSTRQRKGLNTRKHSSTRGLKMKNVLRRSTRR
jgi:hypothetical protein